MAVFNNIMSYKKTVKELLGIAGIKINGKDPWDIKVYNPKFYKRFLAEADIGLGESYMDHWWDCDRLDLFFEKLMNAKLEEVVKNRKRIILDVILSKFPGFSLRPFQ